MIKFENECVGCPKGMGCLGSGCPYTHVPYLVCDNCGDEVEKLYDTEDGQLCEDCCAGRDKEDYTVIDEDNVCDFASWEEDDPYDYADLAYEQSRDERWMEEHE